MRLSIFLITLAAAACDAPRSAPGDRAAAAAPRAEPIDERIGLPLYPRARVIDARLTSGDGPGGAIVRLATTDKPHDVIAFYRLAGRRAGWTVRTDVNLGNSRLLGLSRMGETLAFEAAKSAPTGGRVTIIRARGAAQPS